MDRYSITRPTAADAAAIYDLVTERDTAVIGRPDATPQDIADLLAEPSLDQDRDSWLVLEQDRLVGWGWVRRKGTSDIVDVDVVATKPDAAEWLWAALIERAGQIVGELGHRSARLDIGIYREDTVLQAAAAEHGFEPATSFHRMRIDHSGLGTPAFLPGVTVESGTADDEELLRTGHAILEEGFTEHFGFVPRTFDEWADEMEASSTNDWGQLLVVRVHGEPAAMLLGSDHFVSDENCGYVRTLAVRPGFRGRGLGKLLLKRAFAADERRGRVGTILHVDSNNATPALDLYVSAGMRRVLVIDVWRKTLSTERQVAPTRSGSGETGKPRKLRESGDCGDFGEAGHSGSSGQPGGESGSRELFGEAVRADQRRGEQGAQRVDARP